MSNLTASITISFIAMAVIFITLTLLILVVRVLVAWWPYKEPPAAASNQTTGTTPTPEHLAAIHAALAQYFGKTPDEIQLHNVKPL